MPEPSYSFDPEEREGVVVRRLRPATKRPGERPRWEVSVGGQVIGWVDERRIRAASSTFYFAVGIHPETGKEYRLEGSTQFDERLRVLRRFHADPMTSRQHLGLGLWPAWDKPGSIHART